MSKWIEFVKEFASKKGMSYKNALKDPECKKSYSESKTASRPESSGEGLEKEIATHFAKDESDMKELAKAFKKHKKVEKVVDIEGKEIASIPKRGRKKKPIEKVESESDSENIKMEVVLPKQKGKRKSSKKAVVDSPPIMEGEGLQVKYTAEAINGLEHIYPISHDMVLKIVNTL